MLVSMGIIIAGFFVLVYGLVTKTGNAFMIRGSMYAIVDMIIMSAFAYLYMKAKKTDIIFEITKNSISSTCEHSHDA